MATFKEQVESLKAKLAEAEGKIVAAEERARQAYTDGVNAAREFDAEMDTFLAKFMKREDSSIIVFAIALGLVLAGGLIGYAARGIL